jgi:hypothetical protein
MSEGTISTEHHKLRLSPEDAALLWGVVEGFLIRNKGKQRWPRLERILFDLDVMMRKQEPTP